MDVTRQLDQMDAYERGFIEGTYEALIRQAEVTKRFADILCPKDTRALVQSGKVVEDAFDVVPGRIQSIGVTISYGGEDSVAVLPGRAPPSAYAVIVHEDLEAYHQPPTQAKWLARAIEEAMPGMSLRVGEGAVRAAKAAVL